MAVGLAVGLVTWLAALAPGAAAAVPAHGRAWELVTQGDMGGVRLLGIEGWTDDGNRAGYVTLGPTPGAPSGELIARGVATRGAQGWTMTPIGRGGFTVPTAQLFSPTAAAVNADLTTWIWESLFPLTPGAPAEPQIGLYRLVPDGAFTLLGSGGELGGGNIYYGGDDTLQHYVFDTGVHLLPGDSGRIDGSDAYEYVGSELRMVSLDDAGQPISPLCGSMIGNGNFDRRRREHVISRDGSRIFFTAPMGPSCPEPQSVYLRTNGSDTTQISASQCARADCNAQQPVSFVAALADGSSAFVATSQQLTDDDVDEGADLYRYDVGTGDLVRASAGAAGTTANVIADAAIRSSDDGRRVYFLANGALLPGLGVEDGRNLYLNDHGTLHFVATIDDLDLSNTTVSNDGGTLLFETADRLLPSDTDEVTDVYQYDTAAGLSQVSEGLGGSGNAEEPASMPPIVTNPITPEPMRFLSGDGRHAFFVTNESLLPEDTNTTADAYERADGELGLLSSGHGDELVTFGGVSLDGRSAYVVTDETLVPTDPDGGDLDIYDARLGGGFPTPPGPTPGCSGDACQGAPAKRADRPVPGSVTAEGEQDAAVAKPFALGALGTQARRTLAKTGRAVLSANVPEAGRVSLVARARLRGRAAIVARATAQAKGAGVVRLRLRLSATARRSLRRHGSLRLSLAVSHSRLGAAPTLRLTLRRAS